MTLISPRRYGKTGLIFRTFDDLREKNFICIYADIFSAQNLDDFIKILSEAVVSNLASDSLIKKFFNALKNARPLLSYDPISGSPQVTLSFLTDSQKQPTLKSIFDFLEKQGKQIVFAIDEFQQIREFKETNVEALLRTYIQQLHHVKFIFSGSKKHLMADMFTNAKHPFYESSRTVYIDRIDLEKYKEFITGLFKKARWWIRHKKLTFADQSALIRSTKCKKMLPQRFNDQKFLHRHTVVRHFSKRLFWLPYPHTDNIKQWNISKVHSVFGYRQFDDIYREYQKIINPSPKE